MGSKTILHVITSIASGGAENHLFTLAQQQVNEGLRVAVACLRDGDSRLKTAFEECGVAGMPLGLRCYGQWGPVRRLRAGNGVGALANWTDELGRSHWGCVPQGAFAN